MSEKSVKVSGCQSVKLTIAYWLSPLASWLLAHRGVKKCKAKAMTGCGVGKPRLSFDTPRRSQEVKCESSCL